MGFDMRRQRRKKDVGEKSGASGNRRRKESKRPRLNKRSAATLACLVDVYLTKLVAGKRNAKRAAEARGSLSSDRSTPAGDVAAVDIENLPGDKARVRQIAHRRCYVPYIPIRPRSADPESAFSSAPSISGVRVKPGATQFTRMPAGASSEASATARA
jgi:hypothetical protein